ncbi:MAG: NAD(P)H-dependent oxidoreductase subunit E [Pseudomonadota bacterium]
MADSSQHSEQLLQRLIAHQRQHSFISAEAMEQLGQDCGVPIAQVRGVVEFYSFLHLTPRGDFDILFSDNITDHMAGSSALMEQLCLRLGMSPGEPRADGRVSVDTTSCIGMCDQGPAMLVNGQAITRLDGERIEQIAQLVEQGTPLNVWPSDFFVVDENLHQRDLLLSQQYDQGAALHSFIEQGADAMLDRLDASGLRGRGGAGFPTATKWRSCRDTEANERYVVCNADEGEPGTFKDRLLLQSYADGLFEGMTLCGGTIGAKKGLLYLRGEYLFLLPHLELVLESRRKKGLLGKAILGQPGFDFEIEIHLGAGAYICGEESALLESLEGRRGVPRKRPPFPVTAGYKNAPTVINNVETLLAAAYIAEHGSAPFCSRGTECSTGTKLLSISGDVRYPGIYELPMGMSIREILERCGAEEVQAVQVAGAAGVTLGPDEFDRCVACEDIATGGAFMVFNRSRDLLEMTKNFAHFFAHESCGFCTPCRVGAPLLRGLVEKLCNGHATGHDLNEMRAIGEVMRSASHCGLGKTVPSHLFDLLDKFPQLVESHLCSSDYEPAFDLDAAVSEAREITGRHSPADHLREREQ